jgi:hypothetical protein
MNILPKDLEDLILEYTQEPELLVIKDKGRFVINRNSDKIKEIGGIVLTKHIYPLYSNRISESNKTLYFHAKDHYANTKEHILIKYNKR